MVKKSQAHWKHHGIGNILNQVADSVIKGNCMSDRPIGVTAIAILNVLGGIAILFLGLNFPFASGFSTVFAGVALAEIVISIGLLLGSTWAWYFAMISWILNIVSGIALSLLGSSTAIFSVLLGTVCIVYFLQKHVKEFFEI
jgi:hypothetical protein